MCLLGEIKCGTIALQLHAYHLQALNITFVEIGYYFRVFIRHWRLENSPFTRQNSPANVRKPMAIFHSD